MAKAWKDRPEEWKQRRNEHRRKGKHANESRAARARALWADPAYREKTTAAIEASWDKPERRNPKNTTAGVPRGWHKAEIEAEWARLDALVRRIADLATDSNGEMDNSKFLMGLLVARGKTPRAALRLINSSSAALALALLTPTNNELTETD